MKIYFFRDLSFTHGRVCVCGHYAPVISLIGKKEIAVNVYAR